MTDSMSEVVERLAKAVYARNGWWRIVSEDDDGKGRYRNTGEHRMRAVEWSDLDADERGQMLLDIRAALTELSAMGLVVVEKEPSDENLGIHPAMDVNAARKYRQESFALIARLASKVQP